MWESIEAFQAQETWLLQEGRYKDWLGLLTEDIRYWMPIVSVREQRAEMVSREGELAYFDDDIETLTLRVQRLLSGKAHTEVPPSRVRYFIQNLRITPDATGSEVAVLSNFLIYQARLEHEENFFVGEREDVLRKVEGGWKIARRKITLDRSILGAKNLSIFF